MNQQSVFTSSTSPGGSDVVLQLLACVNGQSASVNLVPVQLLDRFQRVRSRLEVDEAVAADDGNVQNIAVEREQLSQVGGVDAARNVVHEDRKHFWSLAIT